MPEETVKPRVVDSHLDREKLKSLPPGTYLHAHTREGHDRVRKKQDNKANKEHYIKALKSAAAWVEVVEKKKRIKAEKDKLRNEEIARILKW